MQSLDAEERRWIEENWTVMSRSVLKIIMPLAMDVVDDIADGKTPPESAWRRFADDSARALDRVREASSRSERDGGRGSRSTMYAAAISLLGDIEPMKAELIRAGDKLRGPKSGAVVWGCLRSGLYRMRLRASDDIENRARTWRRLQPIVAAVHDRQRGFDLRRDERYSAGVCVAVAAEVRLRHPNDHNLPRNPTAVKEFFAEFCDDFFEPEEVYDVEVEDIELLPDRRKAEAFLAACIEALEGRTGEVYRVSRSDRSVSAYCLQAGLSRRKFYRIVDEALALLDACIRGKFAARVRPVLP